MTIYLAGIAHEDPLGRNALISWLRSSAETEGTEPAFVGVEYSEAIFNRIKTQRGSYRNMVAEILPDASESERDAVISSFAYDGDTHLEVFPSTATVWLDAHRYECANEDADTNRFDVDWFCAYTPREINGIAKRRADTLRETSAGGLLATLNHAAWSGSHVWDPWEPNPDLVRRNELWTDVIISEMDRKTGKWAAVVVGAKHVAGYRKCLIELLDQRGVKINAKILPPPFNQFVTISDEPAEINSSEGSNFR